MGILTSCRHSIGQGHYSGEEDHYVVHVVRVRNVQEELSLPDLLEVRLWLKSKAGWSVYLKYVWRVPLPTARRQ